MVQEPAAPEFDLRAHWQTLRRRKYIVLVCIALTLGTSLAFSLTQTDKYAAVAKVLLKPQSAVQVFGADSQSSLTARQKVTTEIEVITTEPVVDLVRQKIGDPGVVKVSQIGETDLIAIRGESPDPARAAAIANAFATSYIEYRRQQANDELFAGAAEVQGKIAQLQTQIDALTAELENAPVCVDQRTTPVPCTQRTNIEQNAGQRRLALLGQQALFRGRLDQLQVDTALTTGGAQVVLPASARTVPFAPRHRRTAVLGLLMGIVLGTGLAFVIDHLDDSLKTKEDFERVVSTIPVLSLVPALPEWRAKEQTRLISVTDPSSAPAEAYRILRTSIQFLRLQRDVRIIQVTSASAQEGKTTTLANLAVAFSRSGLRTIVVCCDLRRPRLHEFFGVSNDVGFTSVLLGQASLQAALQPVVGQRGLLLLASGQLPPNPSELLSNDRTAELLKSLSVQADIVLVDSPPTLVTDAMILSQQVDATILVVKAGTTTRKAVAHAAEMLSRVKAPIVGAVLNAVTPEAGYGGSSYGYGYSYTSKPSTNGASATNVNGDDNGSTAKRGLRVRRRARKAD